MLDLFVLFFFLKGNAKELVCPTYDNDDYNVDNNVDNNVDDKDGDNGDNFDNDNVKGNAKELVCPT